MNFAPIGALALFSGAYFSRQRDAVAIPAALARCRRHFHRIPSPNSLCVRKFSCQRRHRVLAAPEEIRLAHWRCHNRRRDSVFLITNFAVWASSIGNYPKNAGGLVACYIAGLPLFWNTLAGDAFYAALLFGGMALAEERFPSLREPLAAEAGQ